MQTPRTEFAQALRAISNERGLDSEIIVDSIKHAIVAAFKRDARERGEEIEDQVYDVEIDSKSGEAKIFAWPEDKPEDKQDVTPPGFGRIAAQTAKQVIHQKIREAEKGAIMDEFSDRVGSLISGMILRFDGPDVRVDLGRTEGVMPGNERVPDERLSANQRLTFFMKDIVEAGHGKQIILSRSDPRFVEELFAREVPEISSGSVEINAISREPGIRTKIAVSSNQSGVDPVGSCVGQKGVRVQAVTNELGGERVDIIPYNEDDAELIKASLLPAEDLTVTLDEDKKIAKVSAPEDQLSLAIGKDGQNVRLAAKLTGWKIEVKEAEGADKPTENLEEEKPADAEDTKESAKDTEEEEAKSKTEKAEEKDATAKDDDQATDDSDSEEDVDDSSGDEDEKSADTESAEDSIEDTKDGEEKAASTENTQKSKENKEKGKEKKSEEEDSKSDDK